MKPSRQLKKGSESYFNRELSWLAFNARVLEEAASPAKPPAQAGEVRHDRVLEFFMVRVAGLQDAASEGDERLDPAGLTTLEQFQAISARVHTMVGEQHDLVTRTLLPALATCGITVQRVAELNQGLRSAVSACFRDEVLPALTPLAIDTARPFPMLVSLS